MYHPVQNIRQRLAWELTMAVTDDESILKLRTIDYDDMGDFWNSISPIGGQFGSPHANFVFRGHRNSSWGLIPKVYRRDVLERYKRGMMGTLKDHPGQFFFEWILLSSFMTYCDSVGLSIPNDSMEFRNYFAQHNITNVHGIHNRSWPQDNVVALMALAQHHGIPTRLLDWTSRAYVAAYFAAASTINSDDTCDRLAIFGVDLNGLHAEPGVRHVKVPGSTSSNLPSQGGSFILVDNSGLRGEAFTPDISLESRLGTDRAKLTKVTLPSKFAGELLSRCDKFGISAATVFPGYDGAGRAVLESIRGPNWGKL